MEIPYPLFKELVEDEFQGVSCHCMLNQDRTATLVFRLNDPKRTAYEIPAIDFASASYWDLSLLIIDLRNHLEAVEAHASLRLSA